VKRLFALRKQRFVRDAVALQIATAVTGVTYFVTSVLTERYLGIVDLGRWNAARTIFTMAFFFMTMGVLNSTVSRYSEAVGRQSREDGVRALAGMLKIGAISSLIVLVLGFTLGPWVGERFYGDRDVGSWAAILCIAGLFEVVRGLTVAALMGTRQMKEYAWFDVTTNVLRVGIVWAALHAGLGIGGVVGAFLLHMLVAGAMAVRWYQKARDGHAKLAPPPLREVFLAAPRAPVGHIFGLSYLLALNKGMNTLVPQFGMLLIPALGVASADLDAQTASFRANGHYGIAWVLSWGAGLAMTGVAYTLLPALGLKLGGSDVSFEEMGGIFRRVSLGAGLFMVAATVLSVPVAWFAITFAYGPDAAGSFPYFLWLVSGNLFLGFTVVVDAFYIYSGHLKRAVRLNFLLAGSALVGIILAGRHFGPIGVAAAAGLCRGLALIHLVYMGWYFRRARERKQDQQ